MKNIQPQDIILEIAVKKSLKNNYDPLETKILRDRNEDFQPTVIKKHKRSISSFDDKIISMYMPKA